MNVRHRVHAVSYAVESRSRSVRNRQDPEHSARKYVHGVAVHFASLETNSCSTNNLAASAAS